MSGFPFTRQCGSREHSGSLAVVGGSCGAGGNKCRAGRVVGRGDERDGGSLSCPWWSLQELINDWV